MGSVAAGQVVFLPYPFSDLSDSKLRPVVVLAKGSRSDWIVCQITSNPHGDQRSFVLPQSAFVSGGLRLTSYVRPGLLFTAKETLIRTTAGELRDSALEVVRSAVVAAVYDR
jgi:mRNA interferase MazF